MPDHKPLPKTWRTGRGDKLELIGGKGGTAGQWVRCPEPYDPELPMPDGQVFVLVRNYPHYKYEWCYVEKGALHAG